MNWPRLKAGLKKHKLAVVFLVLLAFIILAALLAPYLAPHDPNEVILKYRLQGPSRQFPLGTDDFGRCLFSRLLFGARISLSISLLVVIVSLLLGTLVGVFSGYKGGKIDSMLMRLCDVLLAFPSLVLVLVIIGILGPGMANVVLAMIAVQWLWYARIIRSTVLSLKERPFVAAARLAGSGDGRIIWKHILPNIMPQIIVLSTLDIGNTIMHFSGYSFLGLGVQPPTPEWGIMISDGRDFIRSTPELMAYPGTMIFLTVLSLNYLGDVFRDLFEEIKE
jgi:nickel transport system permease protein